MWCLYCRCNFVTLQLRLSPISKILTKEGCKEIYLFGSLVNGSATDKSDIDLAVTGIRKEDFFEIFGELMMSLDHPVDLINLEKKNRFVNYLKEKGDSELVPGKALSSPFLLKYFKA